MKYACSFCQGRIKRPIIVGAREGNRSYDVYMCNTCQIGITTPILSREERSGLYAAGAYRAVTGKRFHFIVEYLIYLARLHRKRRITKYKQMGRILDIGCGRGLFLSIMKMHGWEVAGTERDEETAKHASVEHDIQVMAGDVCRSGFEDEHFDVITLIHVLEHMDDPERMIRECNRLLKNGGMLVVAVPNLSSLQASFGGKDWFHLDPPYHVHHFTEQGLLRVLDRESFTIRKIKRFDLEHNPFGWLQTLWNRTGMKKNFIYNYLKREELRTGRDHEDSGKNVIYALALFPLFFPLSILLALYESLVLKRSGTVEVYATKQERLGN